LTTLPVAAATATAPASLNEATIAQLQAAMGAGRLQSTDLVIFYLARIQTLVPVGISFMGTAFSEPVLIKVASGFEAVTHATGTAVPGDAALQHEG
jgi:Asp-tRNA(Asn)/Glu-tRNA(Gln) amidotransferase A subunit family amidase